MSHRNAHRIGKERIDGALSDEESMALHEVMDHYEWNKKQACVEGILLLHKKVQRAKKGKNKD